MHCNDNQSPLPTCQRRSTLLVANKRHVFARVPGVMAMRIVRSGTRASAT